MPNPLTPGELEGQLSEVVAQILAPITERMAAAIAETYTTRMDPDEIESGPRRSGLIR
jgi:hypothetical protein